MPLKSRIAQESEELCHQFGIKRLAVFGSVARDEEGPESDIDFLVEFDDPTPDRMPDRYFGFIDEVTRRFGRPVQVLTPGSLTNPFLRRSIERDLQTLHE